MSSKKVVFKGQVFAFSGKLMQPRKELEELVVKLGGEVSGSVTASVTFLISNEDDVKALPTKVATAQGRGVPIVSEAYIGACFAAKRLLPHAKFVVKGSGPGGVAKRKAKAKAKAAGAAGGEAPPAKKPRVAAAAAAPGAAAEPGPVMTTDKVAVMPSSGLADVAKVVEEDIAKGFVKAKLTWDVELILHDPEAGKDKFYNMQLLASNDGDQFWAVQNWGKTGMPGRTQKDGPFESLGEAKKVFRKKFRSKSGNVFGSLSASFAHVPGKYRLLEREAEAAPGAPPKEAPKPAKWQYYLHNKVDGKKLGWYDYDEDAGKNMEKYYQQFVRDASLNVRLIQSDYFKYEVDFTHMHQKNTKSGMRRVIRRVETGPGTRKPSDAAPTEIPEPALPDPAVIAAAAGAESSTEDEEAEDDAEEEEDEEMEDEGAEEAAEPEEEAKEEEEKEKETTMSTRSTRSTTTTTNQDTA
uniref:NAD(+) ADP-ribosyltransferase n=1 Tax=Crypthecodinium cohnii TaxID=2866 RepID=A0A516AGM5_CRYCO|nr:poly [ADP-ribose] polymerase 2 [Crypthecodinium cohnii]